MKDLLMHIAVQVAMVATIGYGALWLMLWWYS